MYISEVMGVYWIYFFSISPLTPTLFTDLLTVICIGCNRLDLFVISSTAHQRSLTISIKLPILQKSLARLYWREAWEKANIFELLVSLFFNLNDISPIIKNYCRQYLYVYQIKLWAAIAKTMCPLKAGEYPYPWFQFNLYSASLILTSLDISESANLRPSFSLSISQSGLHLIRRLKSSPN